MAWLGVALMVAAIGVALWHYGAKADRVEDECRDLIDGRDRDPYGSKWLKILSGRNSDR